MGKKKDMQLPVITISYKELNKSALANVLKKFKHAQVPVKQALRLRSLVKAVEPVCIEMENNYETDVLKPHQEKIYSETGIDVKAPRPPGESISPELQTKLEALDKDLGKAQEEFAARTVDIEVIPLGPEHLEGIPVSPAEIEALGPFFDETGEVRTEAFKRKLGVVEGEK